MVKREEGLRRTHEELHDGWGEKSVKQGGGDEHDAHGHARLLGEVAVFSRRGCCWLAGVMTMSLMKSGGKRRRQKDKKRSKEEDEEKEDHSEEEEEEEDEGRRLRTRAVMLSVEPEAVAAATRALEGSSLAVRAALTVSTTLSSDNISKMPSLASKRKSSVPSRSRPTTSGSARTSWGLANFRGKAPRQRVKVMPPGKTRLGFLECE
mmetsp:Transcript_1114/g.3198  ORF Transcript_1114/g.3198 Transcript_1114/m.3198 type:complete len:207 (-) Transcript_1114:1855-2475(-)